MGQRPCLVLVSGADETIPDTVDVPAHAARLEKAVGSSAHAVVVPGAPHALEGHEEEGIRHVLEFLTRCDGKEC